MSSGWYEELEKRSEYKRNQTGKATTREYDVWEIPNLMLRRWKFNEWDYYSDKADLPIKARGLFTLNGKIKARGFDKFFNVDEVKTTKKQFLLEQTRGPYIASVKENGFLTLISGHKGQLIVTSKNSCGPCSSFEDGKNYSKTSRDLVLKHLKAANHTESEFAYYLEQHNLTAVGEVCDDSFEEHVLPYPPELAGVYLIGLNHNEQVFRTEHMSVVNEVSDMFGFKKTDYLNFDDYESLQAFLKESASTGSWGSREVEGFVIRCKVDGNDFFYKYKFEEPYLMYREWREVAKLLISSGREAAIARAQRSRHKESSLKFLGFARHYLAENPSAADKLAKLNLGIIEMRSKFLESHNTADLLAELYIQETKTLLVPASTIGCGKSTVARALTELASFGHCQNDSMTGKKGKFGSLVTAVYNSFANHETVVIDRNNSSFKERQQIIDEFKASGPAMGYEVKFICLNFLPNGVSAATRKLTRKRVNARGDNHQTIAAKTLGDKGVDGIMRQFESRFQSVDDERQPDASFAKIIDLEAGETKENVKTILNEFGISKTDEEIDAAVQHAIGYVEDNVAKPKPVKQKAVYYGARLSDAQRQTLLEIANPYTKTIKIQPTFHVTLAHKSSHQQKFNELKALYNPNAGDKPANFNLKCRVVEFAYNDEIAAFRTEMAESANQNPHITVGTKPPVKPVDAKKLFEEANYATERFPVNINLDGLVVYGM